MYTAFLELGPVSWRSATVKWRRSSQSNRHSTIGTRQTQYHEVLPLSANASNDGNTSWYWVCRVPMVEWRLDCEDCRHLTVVDLHDTGPWSTINCQLRPKIHGYTGCKRTGFMKPDSMKLANGHPLHNEAGPWSPALQTPGPPWIQGLVGCVLGGEWLFTLSLPLQSPFTWPSLQYPLFKLLQLFACKARDSTRFFMTRAMHGTWFLGLRLI